MLTTAILSVKDVSEILGTTEWNVTRLIARGRLKATALGTQGGVKILEENLLDYIAEGARDFDSPGTNDISSWIEDAEVSRLAEAFQGALTEAARQQVPSEGAMIARLQADPDLRDVPLDLSEAMKTVAKSKPPVSAFATKKPSQNSPYADWREVFLVNAIRDTALRVIRKLRFSAMQKPIDELYANPGRYREILAQAWAEMQKGYCVVFSKSYSTTSRGIPQLRTVSFSATMSYLLPAGVEERINLLAF